MWLVITFVFWFFNKATAYTIERIFTQNTPKDVIPGKEVSFVGLDNYIWSGFAQKYQWYIYQRFLNTNWTPLILPKGTNEKAPVLIEAGGFTVLNTMHFWLLLLFVAF